MNSNPRARLPRFPHQKKLDSKKINSTDLWAGAASGKLSLSPDMNSIDLLIYHAVQILSSVCMHYNLSSPALEPHQPRLRGASSLISIQRCQILPLKLQLRFSTSSVLTPDLSKTLKFYIYWIWFSLHVIESRMQFADAVGQRKLWLWKLLQPGSLWSLKSSLIRQMYVNGFWCLLYVIAAAPPFSGDECVTVAARADAILGKKEGTVGRRRDGPCSADAKNTLFHPRGRTVAQI